jgi:hypothetical integral membrane protein (TIGR02206 family)
MHEHYLIPVYSFTWWGGIFFTFLFYLLLGKVGHCLQKKEKEYLFRRSLLFLFLAREAFIYSYYIYSGLFTWQDSLPLHLCGISNLFCLIILYKPVSLLYEYLLMLGSVGALMSFLTPEMTHGYTPFLLVDYYLNHGLIIFLPLYFFFILGIRPRQTSWLYVFLFGNVILATVGTVNYFLGSNYIYLCEPPKVDNILITGKFPYHIVGFEVIGFIFIVLIYSLFIRLNFNIFSFEFKKIKWC